MIATITVAVLAVVFAAFLLRVYQQRRNDIRGIDDIASHTNPVDIPALLNLLDEDQENFLCEWLPRADFKALQRRRIRLIWQYIARIAANAAVLERVGDAARRSANPEVASAARELATLAVQARMYAFLASLQLIWAFALLHCPSRVEGAVRTYVSAVEGTEHLARLQCPQRVSVVSAHL